MLCAVRKSENVTDDEDAIITHAQVVKFRDVISQLAKPDVDLERYYIVNNMYKKPAENLKEKYILNLHCINWLYTIRCEQGRGGLRYIENCLWALKRTLDKFLEPIEFEYVKMLISILFEVRNLYNKR